MFSPHTVSSGRFSRLARWCAVCLCASAWGGAGGLAQENPEARFHDVKAWRGTFLASVRSNETKLPFKLPGATFTYDAVLSVEFVLDEFEDEPAVWRGRVVGSNLDSAYRSKLNGNGARVESWFGTSGPLQLDPDEKPELQFHPKRGWSFKMKWGAKRPMEVYKKTTLTQTGQVFRDQDTASAFAVNSSKPFPFPARGFVLYGTGERETTLITSSSLIGVDPHPTWEVAVYLEPAALEELKLEIEEPANYQTWRPETTPDAGPGDPLAVTARVVTASGGKPPVRVEKFIWELEDTSGEPGVAMNYPVGDMDVREDLYLEADGEMFVLNETKQRMERAVREGFTDAVKVVPRDWGGWSKLQVTAVMADGRRVKGKLTGKSEFGLRVPKRAPESHIADGWKEQHKSGADELDDEDDPVGDGNKGDGYTLWEEYRGWIVDGKHVDGDPKKKDFFVLNRMGPDGDRGIGLFKSLSKLRVHTLRSENEMSVETRLMNQNYTQGAHVIDQHGVWIKTFDSAAALGGTGGFTVATSQYRDSPVGFRPGAVEGIGILPRGHADSDFSKPYNLAPADQGRTFDRAVAHEIMHSVGALEHGNGDGTIEFVFVSPTNENNTAGRPYFAMRGAEESPVELLEETGGDVAAKLYPRYQAWVTEAEQLFGSIYMGRPGEPGYPKMSEAQVRQLCESMASDAFALSGLVGAEHGQHSGNQDCIMRYHFATFYPMTGGRNGYYRIAAGDERLGFGLCTSSTGTGVNDPGRQPQSRHGSAADGGGNCAGQICPNDAVPPPPAKF